MADKSKSDIKRELNSLWKNTVGQLDEIKDVIVKSSHAGKARLDAAFLERERDERLRELGRLVLEAKEGDLPAAWREKIKQIEELDTEIATQRKDFDSLVHDWTGSEASGPEPAAEEKNAGSAAPAEETPPTSEPSEEENDKEAGAGG